MAETVENLRVKGAWVIRKFDDDAHLAAFEAGLEQPNETVEFENIGLLTGVNEIWRLVTGASANTFTQANTQIGVGDSATAAANNQTDLLASANKTYNTSTAGDGVTVGAAGGTNQALVVKAQFGPTQANYAWNEMVIKNVVSGICLNRAVSALGTKATGTWTAQCTLTLNP